MLFSREDVAAAVNAGAAGQPVIGVTAEIAPEPPVIGDITLVPDTWSTFCDTQVQVAFTDQSPVTGRLFWSIAPTGEDGSRALERAAGVLVADLDRATTPGQTMEFWVVLTDELGATTESAHRSLTAGTGRTSPP